MHYIQRIGRIVRCDCVGRFQADYIVSDNEVDRAPTYIAGLNEFQFTARRER